MKECDACAGFPEEYLCPECGMTGREIAAANLANKIMAKESERVIADRDRRQ